MVSNGDGSLGYTLAQQGDKWGAFVGCVGWVEMAPVVKDRWVNWYKKYRDILTSDIIHCGRPTGRDLDCILHVNPELKTRALALVFNPTDKTIKKNLVLPLYYTGLTDKAIIREREGKPGEFNLDREFKVRLPVEVKASSFTWFIIEGPSSTVCQVQLV